jgi:hypothetical protein
MRHISEAAVKACFSRLLADAAAKDWGGETSDFFTAHLHLGGIRMTAAFLLKGPARFERMTLRHLGKNSDQIVRLADEPAEVLIVQHCHDITPVEGRQSGRSRFNLHVQEGTAVWMVEIHCASYTHMTYTTTPSPLLEKRKRVMPLIPPMHHPFRGVGARARLGRMVVHSERVPSASSWRRLR